MKVIRNLDQLRNSLEIFQKDSYLSLLDSEKEICLTIGNFDGVHSGHLALIDEVKKIAQEKNLLSAVLTFEPHPACFFNQDKKTNFKITSLAQKLKIFAKEEIDLVIILPFNKEISEISANDFIEKIIISKLRTNHLVVGYDFIFGKNRQGNFSLLKEKSAQFNFSLSEISAKRSDTEIYSSSLIRQLIATGNISKANQLLNKKFTISGIVNNGKKLATQLGFPTANLIAKPQIIQPKFGVYKSTTFIPHLNKKFSSITNFGIKPTINSNSIPLFETYISNFSEDIYGKKIIIEFEHFIREEKKFNSLEELINQIKADVEKINL